ncbi:MAG: bifunctional riboflavin kinase/FAD synthetase [Hyphomonadaceae bacterium]
MQRHDPAAPLPDQAKGAAIALGNFDGVHEGHQAVIASAHVAAQKLGAPLAAAVFEPHPRRFFQPDAPPFRLQSPAQRGRALADLGVVHEFGIGFDTSLAQMSDAQFVTDVMRGRFGARHVSVGSNFRFGRGRMGDTESLKRLGAANGFSVSAVEAVAKDGERISSTRIREAVARGAMDEATRLMGRPFAIEGEVERGFARGRGFGFATANLSLGVYQKPRLGVYAVRADLGDRVWRPGVASVGVNPTTGTLPTPLLETHVFEFDHDLYGRTIEVALIAFLRDEARFESIEALRVQMAQDASAAREMLSDQV